MIFNASRNTSRTNDAIQQWRQGMIKKRFAKDTDKIFEEGEQENLHFRETRNTDLEHESGNPKHNTKLLRITR